MNDDDMMNYISSFKNTRTKLCESDQITESEVVANVLLRFKDLMGTSPIRRKGEVLYRRIFRLSLLEQEDAKADHLRPSSRRRRGACVDALNFT